METIIKIRGVRNDTPPEIDEVIKKVRARIDSIFGGGGSTGGSSDGGFSFKSIPLILGVLVLLWVGAGIYQVEQAERSVVLRLGKFQEIKGPGLDGILPSLILGRLLM